MSMFDSFNEKFNQSKIGKFFKLEERGSNFITELQGGTTTFFTMAYILAVNPAILTDSGGSCAEADDPDACLYETRKQYVAATAIASMVACLAMGLVANLPIALSCGMGANAYFTYNVVGFAGSGTVSYKAALSIVFIEGIIFLFLAVTGARYAIVKLIPEPVKHATPAAIGAFLAHLGLQTAEGLGVVVADAATAVTLGGCPPEKRTEMAPIGGFPAGQYTCDVEGGHMTSATTWLGMLGTAIMIILLAYRVRSALLVGIAFVTIVSWFRETAVSWFTDDQIGDEKFEYFSKVVSVEKLDYVFAQYDFNAISGKDSIIALVTLLYVDFLDTSGTLLGLVNAMGFVDEKGDFERSRAAFSIDALATIFGSLLGLSPMTSYIESAAGVEVGSRTGLTAIFVAFYFFIAIFFAPILANIPPWATGGALIIVGSLMARSLVKVKWENPAHALTAFVTLMVMPLTYSISYGLIAGIGSWITMKIVFLPLEYLFGIPDPSSEVIESNNEIEGSDNEPNDDQNDYAKKIDASVPIDATEKSDSKHTDNTNNDGKKDEDHEEMIA